MNFRQERGKRVITALEVTPLVDIVFLLLIFFLLTATYVKNPNLDINLPKASINQVTSRERDITIAITKKGELRYENQEISVEKLEGILRAEYSEHSDSFIVIRADEGSRHGRVVEVMDLAKRIGFGRLAIATQAKSGELD
ncbi:MAG: biopolymer transporter ExbD [Deltaproteobacteria bacterium]|nr:biopolymer transporter ExbD [Deltaproteobacteria bacterium]